MSAFHAAQTLQNHNPPLPFTPKAIIDRLRLRATNGADYVQLQATKALARILGLYDQTKPLAERLRDPQAEPDGARAAGRRPGSTCSAKKTSPTTMTTTPNPPTGGPPGPQAAAHSFFPAAAPAPTQPRSGPPCPTPGPLPGLEQPAVPHADPSLLRRRRTEKGPRSATISPPRSRHDRNPTMSRTSPERQRERSDWFERGRIDRPGAQRARRRVGSSQDAGAGLGDGAGERRFLRHGLTARGRRSRCPSAPPRSRRSSNWPQRTSPAAGSP